jgi:hypothetical protein
MRRRSLILYLVRITGLKFRASYDRKWGLQVVTVKTIVNKVRELNRMVLMQIVPTHRDVVDTYWRS